MKRITLFFALVCASMAIYAVDELYDTNFATETGAVASAKSGNDASNGNDGNTGSRWWSATDGLTDAEKNDQWWQVNLGQERIFNTVQIVWEGAWGKSFDIQVSNDGSAWTTVKEIRDQNIAAGPFPYTQTLDFDKQTAQYVRFQGIARGTVYAYSFWEFRVLLPGKSVETSITLAASSIFAQESEAITLTTKVFDQNGFEMTTDISYEISPAGAGSISGDAFTFAQLGEVTITANAGAISKSITVYGVASDNLALNKTCKAGYEPENKGELSTKANDGDTNTQWVTYADQSSDVEWWYVDLGAKYDVSGIYVLWGDPASTNYILQVREEAPAEADEADDSAWETVATVTEAGINSQQFKMVDAAARYVRLHSLAKTANFFRLKEVSVFGTEWAPKDDKENPMMVKAELVSRGANSVLINVEATDNYKVTKYHIVDAAKGIDKKTAANEGQLTIEGLTPETEYAFVITALDAAGNESEKALTVNAKTTKVSSEYCAKVMSKGNTEAAFVWETDENGAVVITILETLGGPDEATHFRGKGIGIEKFKVGETKANADTYFEHACEGNKVTLSLKDPNNAPAVGTKIYVDNQIIEYTTSQNGDAWPSLTFEYSYGRVCTGDPVLTRLNLSADAYFCKIGDTIHLSAGAVDQLGKPMDVEIVYEMDPKDAGTIEEGIFIPAIESATTITAKAGELSASVTIACAMGGNAAEGKESEAGYEPENQAELAGSANDGDENTAWVTWENRPAEEEWWFVDLGAKYNLAGIEVLWGVDYSKEYILQAREEAPAEADKADDSKWVLLDTVRSAKSDAAVLTVVNAPARYVRLRSLTRSSAQCIRVREVRVFAYDKEKPVLVKAELVSKTWNSAVIRVNATDNFGIKGFRVVEPGLALDSICQAVDGLITINNLQPETKYVFAITAIDNAQYESDKAEVAVTTDEQPKDEGLESIQNSEFRIQKIIENGVLYILRDGVKYNTQGQEVR